MHMTLRTPKINFLVSLFQAGVNAGGGNSGNTILPFISIPTASPQEQDPVSYMPWPHTAHDDPYDELINSVQNSIKNRYPVLCILRISM